MSRARLAITMLLVCVAGLARAGNLLTCQTDTLGDSTRVVIMKDTLVAGETTPPTEVTDSLPVLTSRSTEMTETADTLRLFSAVDSVARQLSAEQPDKVFIPNPNRALWLALVFPGAGQIYNRKYWKLPFIYGGFLGCVYALMWNQQMYLDYSQAYLDIMDDDPTTDSYMDMLPPRYDITGRESQFQTIFKNKKDKYRRYRDLSIFCFVGVYLISVIDAYVDAQLSVFDISRDLSMKLEPAVIESTGSGSTTKSYGIGCSLNF